MGLGSKCMVTSTVTGTVSATVWRTVSVTVPGTVSVTVPLVRTERLKCLWRRLFTDACGVHVGDRLEIYSRRQRFPP